MKKKKKKFAVKFFRRWLDALAGLATKTRDGFCCRIGQPGCAGQMQPGDENCQWAHIKSRSSNNLRWDLSNALTACGHCHQWAHANPSAFGVWLKEKYPYVWDYVNQHRSLQTWREDDYRQIESGLIAKLKDLEADPLNINIDFRAKLAKMLAKEPIDAS